MKRYAIIVALAALLTEGFAAASPDALGQAPTAADEVAIIVHRSNPVESLTLAELRRIFMFETQSWSHGRKITVMVRENGPARSSALALICGISEEQYTGTSSSRHFAAPSTRDREESCLSAG